MVINSSEILYNLEIVDTAYNSGGVGKIDLEDGRKLVIFVPKTVEGDIVDVEIVEKKASFWNANLKNLVKQSPLRVKPICMHYDNCGGCSYMHISYSSQLIIKEKNLKNLFRKLPEFPIEIISSNPSNYRLRISLHAKHGEVGFYANKSHNIIPIDNCLIVKESLFEKIKNFAEELSFTGDIYAIENNEGITLAEIIPKEGFSVEISELQKIANKYFTGYLYDKKLFGKEIAEYIINGVAIPFSCKSFFQANRYLVDNLQSVVLLLAEGLREEYKVNNIIELYAGSGFFTSLLVEKGFNISACEISSDACKIAKCKVDNIDSAKYLLNYIKSRYPNLIEKNKRNRVRIEEEQNLSNEIVLVDPPRMGLDKNIIDNLLLLNPCGIIYISCNPTTLVRDVERLSLGGYFIKKGYMVDMYPHTFHIEMVVLITR